MWLGLLWDFLYAFLCLLWIDKSTLFYFGLVWDWLMISYVIILFSGSIWCWCSMLHWFTWLFVPLSWCQRFVPCFHLVMSFLLCAPWMFLSLLVCCCNLKFRPHWLVHLSSQLLSAYKVQGHSCHFPLGLCQAMWTHIKAYVFGLCSHMPKFQYKLKGSSCMAPSPNFLMSDASNIAILLFCFCTWGCKENFIGCRLVW